MQKQKINFLPQVKLWNAVEFNARPIWENPSLGEMTYDGSANSNKFAVAVQGDSAPHWEYILTSQKANEYAATVLRLYQKADNDNYVNVSAGNNGVVAVYTESLYNESSNKLATMADVQGAVAGASLLGIKMDSSILPIDASYVTMWSDPSNKYYDKGGTSGDKFNPLATIDTVKNAISNALDGLGDLFELKGSANTSAGGTVNGISVPPVADFGELLTYLNGQTGGFSGMDKGSVIIFNNEEYVLLDKDNQASLNSWELLGSITPQTYVVSLGGQSGTLLVSDSFQMADDKTLTLNPASSSVLGGVKTGHSEGKVDSSTKYEFALRVGGSAAANADRGYVSIPIITGAADDPSYGIIANDTLQGLTHIYTVAIDPSTCAGIGTEYDKIRSIQMIHNIGSEDIIVSVYKVRAGNGDQRQGRQLVYVDEIISGTNTLLVDFGSAEAFIACQDSMNDKYLGYVIVIAAGNSIPLTPTMQGDADPDQPVPVNQE